MTAPQEIFDFVARALIKQGKPAKDGGGNCLYRAPDGSKCAVGHLIPDDVAKYADESRYGGMCVIHFFTGHLAPDLEAKVEHLRENRGLLSHLQSAHDTAASGDFMDLFKKGMRTVAQHFGLNAAVLDEVQP